MLKGVFLPLWLLLRLILIVIQIFFSCGISSAPVDRRQVTAATTWELFHAIRCSLSQRRCHRAWETWELLYKISELNVTLSPYLPQLFINYIH